MFNYFIFQENSPKVDRNENLETSTFIHQLPDAMLTLNTEQAIGKPPRTLAGAGHTAYLTSDHLPVSPKGQSG